MAQQLPVSETVTLTDVTSYPVEAQVSVDFPPQILVLQNFGDDEVFVSFDGTNDQGRIPSAGSLTLAVGRGSDSYDVRKAGIPAPSVAFWGYQKVWARTATGGTASELQISVYP